MCCTRACTTAERASSAEQRRQVRADPLEHRPVVLWQDERLAGDRFERLDVDRGGGQHEIFRDLRVSSPLAQKFLEFSSRGALVPDDFTVELWKEHVEGLVSLHRYEPQTDMLILDGIPRTVAQSRLLDAYVDVLRVYYLDCEDKDIMYMRLKRRALQENRLDDASEAVIQNRLYVYEAQTAPVLSHYPPEIVRRIDTGRTPVEVLADILADVKTIVSAENNAYDA